MQTEGVVWRCQWDLWSQRSDDCDKMGVTSGQVEV